MSDEEQNNLKEVEFYSAAVHTWFATRIEHDKHLLSLSAAGIGLLVTLLTAIGVQSIESLILYTFAIFSFVVCILSVVTIFSRNSDHLEQIITNNATEDHILNLLDKVAKSSFMLGITLTAILGISVAASSLNKESTMTSKKTTSTTHMRESVNGASRLINTNSAVEKKSVDGAAKLRPGGQGGTSGGEASGGSSGGTSGENTSGGKKD